MPRRAPALWTLFGSVVLGTGALAPAARAQRPDAEVPRPSRTWALVNANVVPAPGQAPRRATVVLRDGRILAVGADARVPFDAQRVAGDSLWVYAAFVDGLGQAAVPAPPAGGSLPRVPDPDNPPRDRAGLRPERRVADVLRPGDASVDAMRKAGFAVAHTVPQGGYLPGQGAVVLLTSDTLGARGARGAEALVLRDGASQFAQFQNARGVYPATPMAIMASWRGLLRETRRRGDLATAYERGPSGRERPGVDPVYDALGPVAAGQRPVFFYVKDQLEAYRALRLRDDLGFRLVLAGLPDASSITDRLKAANVPLLLTLALPAEKKDSAAAPFVPTYQTGTFANVAGEKANLEARQRATRTGYVETAAGLDRAGVRFAFASLGAKPADLLGNVRRMVKAGLAPDVALAALTTRPAELLGLDRQMGTLEAGKMANVVVFTRPFTDSLAAVRLLFVEGERYSYDPPARRARRGADSTRTGAPAAEVSVAGDWGYEVETPQGVIGGTLTFTGAGDALAGTITSEALGGTAQPLQNLVRTGNQLAFTFNGGQFGTINATITVEGDAFTGTLDVPNAGAVPITGSKRPG